jgi:hypothetical protein
MELCCSDRLSSVSTVTTLRAGRSEFELLSSPPRSDRLWAPSSLLSNGYRDLILRVKRPVREADHSFPSSAEVFMAWSLLCCSPTPTLITVASLTVTLNGVAATLCLALAFGRCFRGYPQSFHENAGIEV